MRQGIDRVRAPVRAGPNRPGRAALDFEIIHALPKAAKAGQASFSRTGGIHASALFDARGRLLNLREDVGRHNALDKLLGAEFLAGHVPLSDGIVFLSGRVSFGWVRRRQSPESRTCRRGSASNWPSNSPAIVA